MIGYRIKIEGLFKDLYFFIRTEKVCEREVIELLEEIFPGRVFHCRECIFHMEVWEEYYVMPLLNESYFTTYFPEDFDCARKYWRYLCKWAPGEDIKMYKVTKLIGGA